MCDYSDSIHAVDTINPDEFKISRTANLLSLIMMILAMAILWVLIFGF